MVMGITMIRMITIITTIKGAYHKLGLLPPPLAAELGYTRVRQLYGLAEVGCIRLRLEGWGGGGSDLVPPPCPSPASGGGGAEALAFANERQCGATQ